MKKIFFVLAFVMSFGGESSAQQYKPKHSYSSETDVTTFNFTNLNFDFKGHWKQASPRTKEKMHVQHGFKFQNDKKAILDFVYADQEAYAKKFGGQIISGFLKDRIKRIETNESKVSILRTPESEAGKFYLITYRQKNTTYTEFIRASDGMFFHFCLYNSDLNQEQRIAFLIGIYNSKRV